MGLPLWLFLCMDISLHQKSGLPSPAGRFASIFSLQFFLQQPFEQNRVITCTMHDMVDEYSIHNQPIDAEILPGDHIAIAAFQQFGISWKRTRQRETFQPRKRIQDSIRDLSGRIRPYQIHVKLCDCFQFPLCRLQNFDLSHDDRSPPAVFWNPPACKPEHLQAFPDPRLPALP